MGERSRFIDEEIEVRFAQEPGPPTSFIWYGREYGIGVQQGVIAAAPRAKHGERGPRE